MIVIAGEGASVHVLSGKNSDSGVDISKVHDAAAAAPVGAAVCHDVLFNVLAECRVTKSAGELDLMSYASWISSMAHVDVMREVHPGMLEYQLEARFLFHIAYHGDLSPLALLFSLSFELIECLGGCRHSAYTCICACGPNSAILHYGHAGDCHFAQCQNAFYPVPALTSNDGNCARRRSQRARALSHGHGSARYGR